MSERDNYFTEDPITGTDPVQINSEIGVNLRARKSVISRRDVLKLGAASLAGLVGCSRTGRKLMDAGEELAKATATPDWIEDLEKRKLEATQAAQQSAQAVDADKASTPESRAQEGRYSELFDTPETGHYNPEALKKWENLEQQPALNENLGITILPSKYMGREGSIAWHAKVAAALGFQSVAIPISPREFVDHTGITTADTSSLDKLLEYEEFDSVFTDPRLKRIHITADVGGSSANAWQISQKSELSSESLQNTYEEVKRAAEYILNRWGHLGKEIIFGASNEIELHAKGGYRPETEDADVSPHAKQNAIAYLNTVFSAVHDVNASYPSKKALKTSVEVLQIRQEFERDALTGLDIVSALERVPDEVTLSAWQFSAKAQGGYWPGKAIELIKKSVPGVTAAITEYGIADADRSDLNRHEVADMMKKDIESALEAGAEYVTVWGLTGFNAERINPDNNELRGLGLIRPDGSIRKEVYNMLRNMSGIEEIA